MSEAFSAAVKHPCGAADGS